MSKRFTVPPMTTVPHGDRDGDALEKLYAAWHREPPGDTFEAIGAAINEIQDLRSRAAFPHDFSMHTIERVRGAMTKMGFATSPSMEEFSAQLEPEILQLCGAIDRLFQELPSASTRHHSADQPSYDELVVLLRAADNKFASMLKYHSGAAAQSIEAFRTKLASALITVSPAKR